jgi:dUTP diphosphatase
MNIYETTLKVTRSHPDAVLPSKAHESDAGYDLVIIGVYKVLSPHVTLYDTGIKLAPCPSVYNEIHARSSLMKKGYMIANNVGIIDNQYRGSLLVALYKFDPSLPDLELPCKAAQLIPRRMLEMKVIEVSELDETKRGEGGFGSTGN